MFTLLTPEETFISGESAFKGPHSADDNLSDCRCIYLTADTGADGSISAWSHTLVEI